MFPLVAGNKDKYFISMPLVTPASSSTTETTNYSRLCRVLVDLGSCALRDCFDSICTPPTLHRVLAANQLTLQNLRSRNGENSFLPSLPQSHQRILTSLYWWLCCAIYAVLLPQWQDGMCSLRPLTRAVKQTSHESNTSETWCMLMLNTLPLMIQNFKDTGKTSGILWCD